MNDVLELFAAPVDGSRPARRLNRALVMGGNLGFSRFTVTESPFAISPDGSLVAYLADQDTDEVHELFVSALDPHLVRPSEPPTSLPTVVQPASAGGPKSSPPPLRSRD